MRSGIYALLSLDGAPVTAEDWEAMGLAERSGGAVMTAAGFVVGVVDPQPEAVHLERSTDRSTDRSTNRSTDTIVAFAGYLDEPEELAGALGMAADSAPAALAAAAAGAFGDEASQRMLGEWTLLLWDVRERELTLLTSESWRDPMHFAVSGNRVAVAPGTETLCGLPWVGRTLDPEGFALYTARAPVRRLMAEKTCWKGVSRVEPGVRESFSASGRKSLRPAPEPSCALWRGSFEDAVAALNVLCRKIVGQHMQRLGRTGFFLSGGLDSTLLTSLGEENRGAGREMFCLSSVAPEGSGLEDEREFSMAAAAQLNVPLHLVSPALAASAYRPSAATFELMQHPMAGLRHYLYEELWRDGVANGARGVIDGAGGEFSITYKPSLAVDLWWLRRWRFELLSRMRRRRATGQWPHGAFHVRLSEELLAALPKGWKEAWRAGPPQQARRMAGRPVGIHPGVSKSSTLDTFAIGGLRHLYPYRDRRLLRLAGQFPAEMFERLPETRILAREMLRGRVPETVRLRRLSAPFSPDYVRRIETQAARELARTKELRQAGAGSWVDMTWLEKALGGIAAGSMNPAERFTAQLTSGAAEFLLWSTQG